ncbi:hypothetical protein MP228_007751 [Amoeboaphelidium protococcarum]|nr:hypothetical protein MP228_007751 [Amoeboaphelidium protococcarum]
MCGISFKTQWNGDKIGINQQQQYSIFLRGPDYQQIFERDWNDVSIYALASVLHMRGSTALTRQPFFDNCGDNEDFFIWNGEAYNEDFMKKGVNDGLQISQRLFGERRSTGGQDIIKCLIRVLQPIDGPYAFLYFSAREGRVYFGRDFMGRRSLTVHQTEDYLMVASIAEYGSAWKEVQTGFIHYFDLNQKQLQKVPVQYGYAKQVSSDQGSLIDLSSIDPDFMKCLDKFDDILTESVRKRTVYHQVDPSDIDGIDYSINNSGNVAIMFSGGIDCSVLAAVLHRTLPSNQSIDLLNVAFENPRFIQNNKLDSSQMYQVPDRLTGLSSYAELKQRYPERQWRFVEVNVPYSDFLAHRDFIIKLMYPSNTTMDLSIAAAFWFATNPRYTGSSAKIVFSGLGPDELLAGYGHHNAAFTKEGHHGLWQSLQKDYDRLPNRNLGRDDRVISSHGLELRVPFLAEEVVNFLLQIPLNWKCNLSSGVPKGVGDKMFLRLYSSLVLGLQSISREAKRAVQFGARTAKMSGSKEQGYDIVVLSNN